MLSYVNVQAAPARGSSPRAADNPAGFSAERLPATLLYVLLALGVFFRLFHFLHNWSFYIDELFLNVNLIKKSFWELITQPLEYQQKVPVGYLGLSRLFVVLLGRQEQALRLFSLLCGLGALFGFVPLAWHFLRGWGVVAAVGVVALAYPLVYHAVEAKQYSAELFATVLALLLYIRYRASTTVLAFVVWGVLGGLLLWFSFPAIFILAGVGIAICLHALVRQDWRQLRLSLIPCALWVANFGVIYQLFVGKFNDSGWLIDFFRKMYDAYPNLSQPVNSARWLGHKSYGFLDYPLGLLLKSPYTPGFLPKPVAEFGWVAWLLLLAGAYYLFKRQRWYLTVLLLPVLLTLLAAAAGQYPFHGRFTLFLAPLLVLMLGFGFQELMSRFKHSTPIACLLLALVLAPALANSAKQAIKTDTFYNRSYSREMLLHINAHFRPGDVVYVYWNMRPAYEYYKEAYQLKFTAVEASYVKNNSTSPADYLRNLKPDFVAFKGKKRLWFAYDTGNLFPIGDYVNQPAWYYSKDLVPGQLVHDYFKTIGNKVSLTDKKGFSVALYELPAAAESATAQGQRPSRE